MTVYTVWLYRMIEAEDLDALIMDILTLGWISLLGCFTFSISMVIWGRNGF